MNVLCVRDAEAGQEENAQCTVCGGDEVCYLVYFMREVNVM
jgi:hypothetical protein